MEKRVSNDQNFFGMLQTKIQALGGVLTNMVIPNIGAFIAWGLLTAFFIPTGWFPNEQLNSMVGPILTYLLPVFVAYTGGSMFGGKRGGVLAGVATMGAIVGADVTMFIGAMILGPFCGWIMKKVDNVLEGKIPVGFEMVVNNFSIGIIGMIFAMGAYYAVGPLVESITNVLTSGVSFFVDRNLLPVLSIINEPAKVLFLNNAISQGIYSPLGLQDALANGTGSSIYFMTDSNPGPGLGVLLAYFMFARGNAKESSPTAAIIHFFGGIHEMYYPYIFMNPIMILPMILGGMGGIMTAQLLNAALIAQPSPGSIVAILALTPRGKMIAVIAWVLVATIISFLSAGFLFKVVLNRKMEKSNFDNLTLEEQVIGNNMNKETTTIQKSFGELKKEDVHYIIFACDAGMGSSAVASSVIQKKLKSNGIDVKVENSNLESIPANADLVICHENLLSRAKESSPDLVYLTVKDYMNAPEYDELVELLK